jgi:hypothetical protein
MPESNPDYLPDDADRVFTQSDKHVLGDLELQPWTPHRIWTAQLLGMAYPNIGNEGRDQLLRTNIYPNAVKDVAIFAWLSTRSLEEVDDAERHPAAAAKKVREFAIDRGLHQRDGDAFWQAYDKFWDVMNEADASATKPKGENGGASPKT